MGDPAGSSVYISPHGLQYIKQHTSKENGHLIQSAHPDSCNVLYPIVINARIRCNQPTDRLHSHTRLRRETSDGMDGTGWDELLKLPSPPLYLGVCAAFGHCAPL